MIAQLPKLKKIVNEKYKIANLLTKGLKKLKYIKTLEEKKLLLFILHVSFAA